MNATLSEQWMNSTDPKAMLKMIPNVSDRKLRLFGVACCRQTKPRDSRQLFADRYERQGVDGVPDRQWASNWCSDVILTVSKELRANLLREILGNPFRSKVCLQCNGLGYLTSKSGHGAFNDQGFWDWGLKVKKPHTIPCRCSPKGIFLDPITIDPRWRNSTVVGLSQRIYDDNRWDLMPLIADALMDASCNNAEILEHCKNEVRYFNDGGVSYWYNSVAPQIPHLTPGRAKEAAIHVRGCWLIDLFLQLG